MSSDDTTSADKSHTDSLPNKPRRRWYQFSLRTLLLFVTVLAAPLAWFGVRLGKAQRQRAAVAQLQNLGIAVSYNHDDIGKPNSPPPGPEWLRNLLGNDFFDVVASVGRRNGLFNFRLTDREMPLLAQFDNLEYLNLWSADISDAGLEHLHRAIER